MTSVPKHTRGASDGQLDCVVAAVPAGLDQRVDFGHDAEQASRRFGRPSACAEDEWDRSVDRDLRHMPLEQQDTVNSDLVH
jgi:hypothetical protein